MDVTSGVATFNLAAQVLLMATLVVGSGFAWAGRLRLHCWIMRVAIVVQLLLIGVIMAPQVGRYYANWSGFSGFTAELVVHHAFGMTAMILSIYINLAFAGALKKPQHFNWAMRSALLTWSASLGLGIHLFWYLWR